MKKTFIVSVCLLFSLGVYAQNALVIKKDSLDTNSRDLAIESTVMNLDLPLPNTDIDCSVVVPYAKPSAIMELGFTGYVYRRDDYPLIRK